MGSLREKAAVEALSENVLAVRFEDLGARIVENAKNRIIDILGCVIGGADAAGNKGLIKTVMKWGGSEEATLMIHGGKVPAGNAAMVNSIMCRSYDFEVMSIVVEGEWIPSHHSGTTVMTALAMGEANRISGKELLTALVAGDDVVSRVLAAGGWDFDLGWDGTMTLPIFGSIPIAGRIMGLNAHQMRHAFGIGLNMIAGAIQSLWDGAATFKLGQGRVAEAKTTEYHNGVASKPTEKFRAYDSYADAFRDYARLLSGNERYAEVLKQGDDAYGFAQALQNSGYATDPLYADKLLKVIGRVQTLA